MADSFAIPRMSLGDVLKRLKDSRQVAGVLAMGSTGKPSMKPYSDYDLAILLAEDAPRLFTASIWIDQQLGDLYFFPLDEIENLLCSQCVEADSTLHKLLDWVQSGVVLYDPAQLFERLKALPREDLAVKQESDKTHSAWFGVNFNFAHNKRYFNSGDEIYLQALEMRLLYCTSDLLTAYHTLRGIPWQGEKSAIKYLRENDPEFLALFQQTIRHSDLNDKFHDYAELVEKVLDGYGGIWAEDECSVLMKDGIPIHQGIGWLESVFAKQ